MTGRTLATLEAAAAMLQRGQAYAALESLVAVIREHGGTVPTPPDGASPPPAPRPEPAEMRLSA